MGGHTSRRTVLALTAAGLLGALAGCVNDDEDDVDDVDDVDDEDDEVDVGEWEDVDEFYFDGFTQHWVGIDPDIIADEENPTITLIEGQEYDFGWINADGATHNLEIRNADDEIIDDYQSDDVSEEGEEAWIEGVVATTEMDIYICTYHEATQVGDIDVVAD